MAASTFTFLSLLTLLAKLGPKIPKAMELLTLLYELFASDIDALDPGGLQLVENTPEEEALIGEISQCLSASGSQAAFDGTRLRKLVAIFNQAANSDFGKFLIAVLTKMAAGS